MTANISPDTGIAYGYISANALDPDVVNDLQMLGTDVYYDEAVTQAKADAVREWWAQIESSGVLELPTIDEDNLREAVERHVDETWEGSEREQKFNDSYSPDEPVHEGEKDGVKYRTSWLGGALNVWIFQSPHVTDKAGRASPCVPNAGILDKLEGDVQAYDVPPEWRHRDDD
jgi:hypothetical protein